MRCILDIDDLPYDAMGDYSAFRLVSAKRGKKDEDARDAGADPAAIRDPLPLPDPPVVFM